MMPQPTAGSYNWTTCCQVLHHSPSKVSTPVEQFEITGFVRIGVHSKTIVYLGTRPKQRIRTFYVHCQHHRNVRIRWENTANLIIAWTLKYSQQGTTPTTCGTLHDRKKSVVGHASRCWVFPAAGPDQPAIRCSDVDFTGRIWIPDLGRFEFLIPKMR